jgi:uncharacterized membrane protein
MAREVANRESTGSAPMDRLRSEVGSLVSALGDRAVSSVRHRVEGAASRLTDYVEGGGGPGLMAAVTGARNLAEGKSPVRSMLGAGMAGLKEKVAGVFGKRKGGGGKKLKVTNIVESIDVGVPIKLAYNQWTQFSDFPKFTKKVENVEQPEETKTNWKAQIFWSHRTWEATIVEQVPDDKIVWRSKGEKGHVDGAVTFHEMAPNLTRINLVLEYHPQGLFERTGNIWRAQGRRARLEFKHFRRHMMTEAVLRPDEIEGWRGTIHDSEVVESHDDAVAREGQEKGQDSRQAGDGQVEGGAQSRPGDREAGPEQDRETASEDRETASGERESDSDDRETAGDHGQRAGRRGTRAARREEDETGDDEAADDETGGEADDGRTARARGRAAASGRGRRSSGTRAAGSAGGGNGRRRTGAATQRGGNR